MRNNEPRLGRVAVHASERLLRTHERTHGEASERVLTPWPIDKSMSTTIGRVAGAKKLSVTCGLDTYPLSHHEAYHLRALSPDLVGARITVSHG